MEKASRALRRSGVKLLSLPGGHGDLNMLVSEIKDIRHSAKLLMNAQHLASQDMMRWAANEENRAIQDVISQVAELNLLWTEVQKLFVEHLKEYRSMFEHVLEGEKRVTEAKTNLNYCEEKENKVKKELKRISKRASGSEMRIFETKVSVAEKAREMAQLELSERLRENEAIKLIQMKSGLMKVSEAYIEMSSKCNVIFSAQKEVVHQLPDVHRQELESIKYTGAGTTRFLVQQARERIEKYNQIDSQEPPPPYTPSESETGVPQPAPRRSSGRHSGQGLASNLDVNTPDPTNEGVVTHSNKMGIEMTDTPSHVDLESKAQGLSGDCSNNLHKDDDVDETARKDSAIVTPLYPSLHVDTESSGKMKPPVPVPRPRLSNSSDIGKDISGDKTKTDEELSKETTREDKVVQDDTMGIDTTDTGQGEGGLKQGSSVTGIDCSGGVGTSASMAGVSDMEKTDLSFENDIKDTAEESVDIAKEITDTEQIDAKTNGVEEGIGIVNEITNTEQIEHTAEMKLQCEASESGEEKNKEG